MLIKRKSLVVSLVSGIVISIVMVLTVIGYFIYVEYKGEEFKRFYQEILGKTKAKVYSKYIDVSSLEARIGNEGPLKGRPILEGIILNKGTRDVSEIVLEVDFLDRDGAAIYELTIHPQEPTLGSSGLPQIKIPYLYSAPKSILSPHERIAFKKIITNCPTEIFLDLRGAGDAKDRFRPSGKLAYRVLSLDFE